ncbi:hypothetical protein Tco_0521185 [Tanacetum coccineum]
MENENPIRTLRDYSRPSHEGYQNTIELPDENNVVPLRSDTIRLVQNGCSFHGLRSEDPNQHLKDFLKLVDLLDLNGESLSEAWTRFKDLLQKVPHHGIDLWLQVQIFYDHVNPATRRIIDQSAGGKLRDKKAKESWALLEDLALYDNEILARALIYNEILDKYVESLELGKSGSAFIQGEMLEKMKYPGLFTLPCRLGDSKPFDTLADLVSYMDKDPATPLLIGRGFLATSNAVIDCKKAKIVVGEGVTRSIFRVKEISLDDEEIPYWTTLGKEESYKPRPSTDGVGALPLFMLRNTLWNTICPGNGNWPEMSYSTRLKTS